jgi:hypothetical protein
MKRRLPGYDPEKDQTIAVAKLKGRAKNRYLAHWRNRCGKGANRSRFHGPQEARRIGPSPLSAHDRMIDAVLGL